MAVIRIGLLMPATLGAALLLASAPVTADSFGPAERTEIESVIRSYLLENPEVIVEAMRVLQAREEAAEAEARQDALSSYRDQLHNDPGTPVVGNPNGDVTVVEFFDYQCGYCKSARENVVALMEADRNVRVVLKEFPILGPMSMVAARAALASREQGRYWDFHNELLKFRGRLNQTVIFDIAEKAGIDTDRLRRDMEKPAIGEAIERNMQLAQALSIRGTPAFVIGDEVVPGAIDLDTMRQIVETMRADG